MSLFGEGLLYGPLYTIIKKRIGRPDPLPARENWEFWTRRRNPLLLSLVKSYPPLWVRRKIVESRLKAPHESGISAHYDIPIEFYRLFLDSKFMFYSCADFELNRQSLEEAQSKKADFILRLIDPRPGERILDLGCGWGGMLNHIREVTGDAENLLGYSLCREQLQYVREKFNLRASFTNFITTDYAAESFDKIYSIGAWEHVRPAEIAPLLQKLYVALRPGGRLIQHFFCLTAEVCPTAMVASQIFFPGSILSLCEDQVEAARKAGFSITHHSTHDYRPTLQAWYQNLVRNQDRAVALGGVGLYNRYLTFFPVSWRFFDEGYAQVHRFVYEK